MSNKSIPQNWTWENLEDCVDILDRHREPINQTNRKERLTGIDENERVPYYGATGQVGWIDDHIFNEELVLLGEDGAPFLDPYKPTAYIIRGKSWVNNHAHVLKGKSGYLNNKFLLYYLNTVEYKPYITGTTRHKLNQTRMKEIQIPVAPIDEQERIVAKIEELFSKLDSGISELQESKQRLNKYRRSVLNKAVNGGLTRGWRSRSTNPQEATESYEFPVIEEDHEVEGSLADLPAGWVWAKLEDITDNFDSEREPVNRSNRDEMQGEYPYYGASGVIDHLDDYILDGRYLLISEDGANLESRTKPIAFIVNGKFWPNNHAHVVQTKSGIPLDYLELYIESRSVHQYLSGTAQPKLTQTNMNKIPVPIAPQEELEKIVELVQRDTTVVESTTDEIEDTLSGAQRLRQSILKSAFEGKLLTQTPHSRSSGEKSASIDEKPKHREQQKLSEVTSDVE